MYGFEEGSFSLHFTGKLLINNSSDHQENGAPKHCVVYSSYNSQSPTKGWYRVYACYMIVIISYLQSLTIWEEFEPVCEWWVSLRITGWLFTSSMLNHALNNLGFFSIQHYSDKISWQYKQNGTVYPFRLTSRKWGINYNREFPLKEGTTSIPHFILLCFIALL